MPKESLNKQIEGRKIIYENLIIHSSLSSLRKSVLLAAGYKSSDDTGGYINTIPSVSLEMGRGVETEYDNNV